MQSSRHHAGGIGALKPVHAGGQQVAQGKYITAGNASQCRRRRQRLCADEPRGGGQKEPQAAGHLQGFAAVGVEPDEMGIGPVLAVPRLLSRHGLSVGDIDLWS